MMNKYPYLIKYVEEVCHPKEVHTGTPWEGTAYECKKRTTTHVVYATNKNAAIKELKTQIDESNLLAGGSVAYLEKVISVRKLSDKESKAWWKHYFSSAKKVR
jgi:hypothetical protein